MSITEVTQLEEGQTGSNCRKTALMDLQEHAGNIDSSSVRCNLRTMPRKIDKACKGRPPRIRVPNEEKVIFTVDHQKFVGIVRCLSLTGGSALLIKGSFPAGTLGELALGTVFGKVSAHIEFLHLGADGVSQAQAFRFLTMDDVSTKRFKAAVKQMQMAGFSDVAEPKPTLIDTALESWNKLRASVRQLSGRRR